MTTVVIEVIEATIVVIEVMIIVITVMLVVRAIGGFVDLGHAGFRPKLANRVRGARPDPNWPACAAA